MGKNTVAEVINDITRKHLEENNGLLLGQSISAVGWVNGTVPNVEGIIELPMTDVAGAGFAVGAAMVGRRPIFIIRFQDFLVLNGSPFINYAAKCKELHGTTAPVFIRAIAADGLGPVHSGVLHSLFMHFPGFRVVSPMTPGEYENCWEEFMEHDDPMFVSEHRESFQNSEELPDTLRVNANITMYGISQSRFALREAAELLKKDGVICNIVHIVQIKPFLLLERYLSPLEESKLGLVIDPSYEICGAARSIAYELTNATGHPVGALGLEDKTKCLCPPHQNTSPDSNKIYTTVCSILERQKS